MMPYLPLQNIHNEGLGSLQTKRVGLPDKKAYFVKQISQCV